jgi:tyrosyl-tRNA synthetase
MTFLEELEWRGLIHDMTPGLKEHLEKGMVTAYIGFDPTAPSLTIGNYVQVMILTFFQRAGHRPVVLMGGATGRIGDPSGKDKERELKTYDVLDANLKHQVIQMKRLLDFSKKSPNGAFFVNNYDFYKRMDTISFLRDVGKYMTVNVMLAKESVKRRIETGISFTEFSYQLIQGYDYVLLNKKHGVTLQMGGSDQYGNITSGTELGRKINDAKLYALTTPLLTKADGEKFGKSAEGNIWLDPNLTSPYKFYQFWINADDSDMPKFFRYFSLKTQAEIEALEAKYASDGQGLKKVFAEEITTRLHGKKAYQSALEVSRILFDNKLNRATLKGMDKAVLSMVAGEIQCFEISKQTLSQGINILTLLAEQTNILPSKNEVKNAIKNQAISVNKEKVLQADYMVDASQILAGSCLLVESGKKNKFLIKVIE